MNAGTVTSDAWSLDDTEVHVWITRLDLDSAKLHDWQSTLSTDERQRADRFHHLIDRHHYVAARAVLRFLLSSYLTLEPSRLEFVYSPFGKPELADSFKSAGISFNVSHSGELALYGITRRRKIGVDLERLRADTDVEAMVRTALSDEESRTLFSLPRGEQLEAFFNCWTRKEAYLKARGEGLSYPLNRVQVSFAPGAPALIASTADDPDASARWTIFHLLPSPGYVAAVVAEGRNLQFKVRKWSH